MSNAPHIPVHLGAMTSTVRYQMAHVQMNKGDVLLANHPKAGGSHLPDLTVITPVFYEGIDTPVFFVANRGHHADIGGISPGNAVTELYYIRCVSKVLMQMPPYGLKLPVITGIVDGAGGGRGLTRFPHLGIIGIFVAASCS